MGMVHVSRAIGPRLETYYQNDFVAAQSVAYYGQQQQVSGTWYGDLERYGVSSQVTEEQFIRLMKGLDPNTGEVRVKPLMRMDKKTGKTKEIKRWGWDAVFQCDKSISILSVHDPRLIDVHEAGVKAGLNAMREFVQAHGGGNNSNITTQTWIAATFTHNTARPVNGVICPHLHTHCVFPNMTIGPDGQWRALDPSYIFKAQKYAKAAYQATIAYRARQLGYEMVQGKGHAPVIKGFTQEYLDSEGLRSQQIQEIKGKLGLKGRRAEEKIAHEYREAKDQSIPPEEVRRRFLERAEKHGNQHERIISEAIERRASNGNKFVLSADDAVTFAIDKLSERSAVFTERELASEAMWYAQGHVLPEDIADEIAARRDGAKADLIPVFHTYEQNWDTPDRFYTTPYMIRLETEVLQKTMAGRSTMDPVCPGMTVDYVRRRFPHLNKNQSEAVHERLTSRDKIAGIQGAAGTGKTTALIELQKLAKEAGHEIVSLAPTTRAVGELKDRKLDNAMTLQRFLVMDDEGLTKAGIDPNKPRVILCDESSLVSTNQFHTMLERLEASGKMRKWDRLIEIGDTRQHESIEPARIFAQQAHVMEVSQIHELMRPQTPQLLKIGDWLQRGKMSRVLDFMAKGENWDDKTARIIVDKRPEARMNAVVRLYMRDPDHTLIVSPDNESRRRINEKCREELRAAGLLAPDSVETRVLVPRQELTRADMRVARSYETGNVIVFNGKVKELGIEKDRKATVISTNTDMRNQSVTVWLNATDKEKAREVTYNPNKHRNVSLYQSQLRPFAVGEKVIFKKSVALAGGKVANGQMATITKIGHDGTISAELDTEKKQTVKYHVDQVQHIDHAYAVTSYSVQGATSRFVIGHMDTSDKNAIMGLTKPMMYVTLSRGAQDAWIVTDDLGRAHYLLGRETQKETAVSEQQVIEMATQHAAIQQERSRQGTGYAI